jgi:uncharacterized protein
MAQQYPPDPQISPPGTQLPAQLSASDEKTWSMLAHFTILLNLFTLVLGPVAALVIYLIYRDRSRLVAFHAMQSLILQLAAWVGGGIVATMIWAVSSATMMFLIGCLMVPFALLFTLLPFMAIVYGLIGGIQVGQGILNFRYWLVGDWADQLMRRF